MLLIGRLTKSTWNILKRPSRPHAVKVSLRGVYYVSLLLLSPNQLTWTCWLVGIEDSFIMRSFLQRLVSISAKGELGVCIHGYPGNRKHEETELLWKIMGLEIILHYENSVLIFMNSFIVHSDFPMFRAVKEARSLSHVTRWEASYHFIT